MIWLFDKRHFVEIWYLKCFDKETRNIKKIIFSTKKNKTNPSKMDERLRESEQAIDTKRFKDKKAIIMAAGTLLDCV